MTSGNATDIQFDTSDEDKELFSLYCFRCGHAWYSAGSQVPKRCPRCHSARWEYPLKGKITCRYCGREWIPSSISEPCPDCNRTQIKGNTDRFLHCNQCDYDWIQKKDNPPTKCPLCRSLKWKEPKTKRLSCNKCGHVWVNKSNEPKRCPKCQTIFWKTPKCVVNCRRCGHEWTITEGKKPEEVRMCPSCKSTKWNETPRIFVCFRCGKTHMMRTNGAVRTCPTCGGTNDTRLMVCQSCGFSWNAIPLLKGLDCPKCGIKNNIDNAHETELLEFWTNGRYKLKFTSDSGFGTIYLWDRDIPVTTMYFHVMCRDLNITADQFVIAVNNESMVEEWEELAKKMLKERNGYKKKIGYFEKRLSLTYEDAEVLAIHFEGMGPEAIALKFGMKYDDVKSAFDRIMAAYSNSGINVDDTVYTENPFDFY